VSASAGVLLGVVLVLVVRDAPPGVPVAHEARPARVVLTDLRHAWLDPGTRLGLWSHFTCQFSANVMGLLWGYPFFVHGQHTSHAVAGMLLSVLVVTTMIGGPVIGGYIARHPWQRSTIVLGIVAAIAAMWTVVLVWPGDAPVLQLVLLVVVAGLGGPGSMIGFDVARTFAPASRLGSATGIVNVGGFVASLLVVLGIGIILDAASPGAHVGGAGGSGGGTSYTAHAYTLAMSVQYLFWIIGATQVFRYRRRARAHLARSQPETFRAMRGY
jgi:MFS family permease